MFADARVRVLALTVLASALGLACGPIATEPISPLEPAWTQFRQGQVDAASAQFESALSTPNLAAEAHLGVGWCRLVRAQLSDAITQFQSAEAFEDVTDARARPEGVYVVRALAGDRTLATRRVVHVR